MDHYIGMAMTTNIEESSLGNWDLPGEISSLDAGTVLKSIWVASEYHNVKLPFPL